MHLHVSETGDFNDTVTTAITSHCYRISVKAILQNVHGHCVGETTDIFVHAIIENGENQTILFDYLSYN